MIRRPPRSPDNQAGFTLVDTLLGVAIMGVGVAALVGGMATSIKTADIGKSSAEANLAVRAFAEKLATTTYAACAPSYATGYAAPTGFTASSSVAYWDIATSKFTTPCGTDSGLQRVTLTVTATDGRASESLTVGKRKRPVGEP